LIFWEVKNAERDESSETDLAENESERGSAKGPNRLELSNIDLKKRVNSSLKALRKKGKTSLPRRMSITDLSTTRCKGIEAENRL